MYTRGILIHIFERVKARQRFSLKALKESVEPEHEMEVNLQRSSTGEDVPAPAVLVGDDGGERPRHYADRFLAEQRACGKDLGKEQLEFLALVVEHLEKIVEARDLGRKEPEQRVFLLLVLIT